MTVSEIENLLPIWEDFHRSGSRRKNWLDERDAAEALLRKRQAMVDRPDFGWETI